MQKLALKTSPGCSKPFGCTRIKEGINFAIYSRLAEEAILCLFRFEGREPLQEIPLDPHYNRTGHVWHIALEDPPENLCYAWRFKKKKGRVYSEYFDENRLLLDPYAKGLATPSHWGEGLGAKPLGQVLCDDAFDWEGDRPLNRPRTDLIIYEMHVRGFTYHTSSKAAHQGTFLGVIDKIPYLLSLGVNAVKLMPVQEFDETEYRRYNPINGEQLCNFWGYSPMHYFSPMNRYASGDGFGQAAREFKTMVKELHRNGIEVLLDVVFNHTGERGPSKIIHSFLGIDPPTYYLFDQKHEMVNFTGCDNTINSNHPIVRDFIKDCLHYWVVDMHVDGFRFDLGGIMFRGLHGEPLKNPPLIEELTNDPILASSKLIAEPWDAAGLYLLGHFSPSETRWSEWNDKYRDEVRQFLKGDRGKNRAFATRLCGSDDIFGRQRSPKSSINFVTAHDGFTLRDLVSYNNKDNTANGENNRDGHSANFSWNCGVEGETQNAAIFKLRLKQMKNFHLTLMLSQGVPMLTMGNEYGHTRYGNNNSWCQDNALNWQLWDQLEKNSGFFRFYKECIHFRLRHPILRRDRYLTPDDIQWHGLTPGRPDWDADTNFLAFLLSDPENSQHLYVACNSSSLLKTASLPSPAEGKQWRLLVDTNRDSPEDFIPEEEAAVLDDPQVRIAANSIILLKCI